jgi:hypothetical protein
MYFLNIHHINYNFFYLGYIFMDLCTDLMGMITFFGIFLAIIEYVYIFLIMEIIILFELFKDGYSII